MSVIIIKGMELPEKCENCPCYDYIDYVCRADDCFAPFDVENPEERSEHCPLVEIPTPHGRLIDADRLIKIMQDTLDNYPDNDNDGKAVEKLVVETCKQFIDHCPTIIEAEVSE